jgi:NAD(P)-dependent dehydrogenase (short-subunit alcohol dehydrogenase family)
VTLVINNAGIAQPGGFLAADSEEVARRIFETNFFGMLRISKAFAPILASQGGGALLNVLSVASWVNGGGLAAYSASKSAAWSLTNALRIELAAQKTQVLALHMAYVDTDLTRGFDVPKVQPRSDRAARNRRTRSGPRRSAGRRTHRTDQSRPGCASAQLPAAAGMNFLAAVLGNRDTRPIKPQGKPLQISHSGNHSPDSSPPSARLTP